MSSTNEAVSFSRGTKASMPSAMVAGRLLIATDTGEAFVDDTSTNRIQLVDTTKLALTGGTMSGPIDMGDNKITTSYTPVNDEDVVNKAYLDEVNIIYTGTNPIIVTESVISHASYTARSGGPTANATLTYGGTFQVPYVTSDETGHVTAVTTRTLTMPDAVDEVSEATHAGFADTATTANTAGSATTAASADIATKLATERAIDGVTFDGSSDIIHYGDCSTASATAAKVVSCESYVLEIGSKITVKFTYTNTVAGPTLNVNSTGAKSIYYNGSTLTSDTAEYILAGHVYEFVYDGTGYVIVGDINIDTDTDTTYDASSPIIMNGTTIEHQTYTARTAGPTANATLAYGESFSVPYLASDEYGHVTGASTFTLTLPDAQEVATDTTYTASLPIKISPDNVITHQTYDTVEGGPTEDVSLNFGESFTVPYFASDSYGHVSSGASYTVTMPDAPTTITGNAGTATKLATARTIDGISFDGSSAITHYGTCSSSASTSSKAVTCDSTFSLVTGARIIVKFTYGNTVETPTMNVNSTGGRSIMYQGEYLGENIIAGGTYEFIYDGTSFNMVDAPVSRTDDVDDDAVQFRNCVVCAAGTDPTTLDVPVGTIIMIKEA